jgi:hypothetical protein
MFFCLPSKKSPWSFMFLTFFPAIPGELGGRIHEEGIEKQRDGDLHGMDRAGDNGEGK